MFSLNAKLAKTPVNPSSPKNDLSLSNASKAGLSFSKVTLGLSKVAAAAVAALAFAQPAVASASTCDTLLGNFNTWFTTQPQGAGTYEVLARLTALRSDGAYASYAEGSNTDSNDAYAGVLTYHAGGHGFTAMPTPAYLSDPNVPGVPRGLTQYFSDRRYSNPCPQLCLGAPEFPFTKNPTDRLGIYVQLQPAVSILRNQSSPAGTTTFTLYSWGNAEGSMEGTCTINASGTGGLLYGFIPTGNGGTELFALSLNEEYVPPAVTPKAVRHR